MTQRNVNVDIEIWNKLKEYAIKHNRNVREFSGEILADYSEHFRIGKESGKSEDDIMAS